MANGTNVNVDTDVNPVVKNNDDLVKLGSVKLAQIIHDTRKEAASNRVGKNTAEAKSEELAKEVEKLTTQVADYGVKSERLVELEKLEVDRKKAQEEKDQADMTEIDKYKDVLSKRDEALTKTEKKWTDKFTEMQNKLEEKDSIILQKDSDNNKARIENVVSRICNEKGFKFRSNYERLGILSDVLKTDSEGKYLGDDVVTERLTKFIADNFESPPAAPSKPQTKDDGTDITGDVARFKELKVLADSHTANVEEKEELKKLIEKFDGLARKNS